MILTHPFQQDVPKNTIRILIEKPMNDHHFRLLPLMENGHYRYVESTGDDFNLIPSASSSPNLQFQVVRDENTRALLFLKGEADVLFDTLSIAKTEWIKKTLDPLNFKIFSSSGESISQLALNVENSFLSDPTNRSRIANALPLKLWIQHVFLNWVEPVSLPENDFTSVPISPSIELKYLSTSSREGQQIAYLTRDALSKVGIKINIHIYEPSLFYAKIKKREFDLFSSTSVPGTTNVLDLPKTELIPLFRWKHGLILNSRIITPADLESTLDYSFRFLSRLQLQSSS